MTYYTTARESKHQIITVFPLLTSNRFVVGAATKLLPCHLWGGLDQQVVQQERGRQQQTGFVGE